MSLHINSASNLELAISMIERQNQQAAEIGLFDPLLSSDGRPSPNLRKVMQVVAKFKKNAKPVMGAFK